MALAPRAFHALTAETWAIEPHWLPMLAAIAQRNHSAPEVDAAREWIRRDHLAMAGTGAQKLAGAHRGFLVNGIGVLPITGPIFPRANLLTEMSGATSLAMLQHDHLIMLTNKDVRGVMLVIDSPGGAVSGIADFASRVSIGAQRKPTHAFVSGGAASAAYWIASAASRISVDRAAVLGSIGIVAAIPKQVQPGQDGFITVEVVSSNAPNKRPDPQLDEGANEIRGTLDALERIFVADVAKGRRVPISKVLESFGRGGLLVGHAAVAVGMADKVESQGAAIESLRLAGRSPLLGRGNDADQDAQNRARLAAFKPGSRDQHRLNMQRLASLRQRRR